LFIALRISLFIHGHDLGGGNDLGITQLFRQRIHPVFARKTLQVRQNV
jgi:hypothetical protein